MSAYGGPSIVSSGLVLNLDAGNIKSYPGSGTTWADLSGYANNGILTNGPTFNSANGGSLVFDGISNYINCGNNTSLNSIVTYTVSTWLNFPTFSRNYNPIFFRHSRGTDLSDIEMYGGNNGLTLVHNRSNGGTFRYNYATGPSSNIIVFLTVTFSNSTWSVYFNSTLSQTFTGVATPLATSGYVTDIGQSFATTFYLQGKIYSQQVYNRALSANEVAQNFNALRGRYGL